MNIVARFRGDFFTNKNSKFDRGDLLTCFEFQLTQYFGGQNFSAEILSDNVIREYLVSYTPHGAPCSIKKRADMEQPVSAATKRGVRRL